MEEGGSGGLDEVSGRGSGGSGIGMSKLEFSMPEVGRDSRERTVDVKPGATIFCVLSVCRKPMSKNDTLAGEDD